MGTVIHPAGRLHPPPQYWPSTGLSSPVMASVRLIAWNCHHGAIATRVAELADYSPDIVFLQECTLAKPAPSTAERVLIRRVGGKKHIALISLNGAYQMTKLESKSRGGRAHLAVAVTGPVSFTVLGIWSQGPKYADDVVRTLRAYAGVLRSGPAIVMGDLNSGTRLNGEHALSKGHSRIINLLSGLGLVSAYHAFHRTEHGHERHPTYLHQFKASQPWHIDFCFVPESWELASVEMIDGAVWAKRSDHLPLRVDLCFPDLLARPR
jgi:endonuclease/exonuclease/phosphatase family metal-dependent hydrolase